MQLTIGSILFCAGLSLIAGPYVTANAAERLVIVEVETLSQPSWQQTALVPVGGSAPPAFENYAPTAFPLWYAFHDGTLDTFDVGEPASPEVADLAKESLVNPLQARYHNSPNAFTWWVPNPPWGVGTSAMVDMPSPVARGQNLDPAKHKFFSYLAKLVPSDDAFIGNDDPQRLRIFDDAGKFLGPFVIDVYGSDVLDAGSRRNDESNLWRLSREVDVNAGVLTSEPIAPHPGYIGSLRNPDGTPGIIGVAGWSCGLTGGHYWRQGCWLVDPIRGDFTRPNFPLLRIRITSGIDGSYSGSWYDPARSGEGFHIEVADGNPPTMAVSWYTYAPDGSGRQVWLVGAGPVDYNAVPALQLYESTGGGFASTSNPANVVRTLWGSLNIGFGGCDVGRVTFTPANPAYPAGDYFIQRLTKPPSGMPPVCSHFSLSAPIAPEVPDRWPYY